MEGTSSNGVTTYDAVVTIDEPGELKPSMNVDAVIVVESAQNVLRIDTNNIKTARGKSYVFVKDDGASTQGTNKAQGMPQGQRPDMSGTENANGERPANAAQGQKQSENGAGNSGQAQTGGENAGGNMPQGGQRQMMPTAPDGFKTVEIEIGISGDDYTEVKSGLSEGDLIYVQEVSSSSTNNMFGPMGGGMPRGGMGGGMPGGGGNMGGGMRR